ncbi:MAG: hypothetical protein PWQ37_1076 [Candidatus Petromonas sp.]|jgi:predicted nucleotidyltransferase|nr:hypothetical protein [Candidatus Petromonas sp.]
MKVLGLITEYNPFHNGHKYHLLKSKKITGATHTVAVMSGHFLQRGEPSIIDKWLRAQIAIDEGIDLVVELPTVFSCSSAEFFAKGSIGLLDSLKIVDYVCFGSEHGNIKPLNDIAKLLTNESLQFKKTLKKYLSLGITFPLARQKALLRSFDDNEVYEDILKSPNNILGIEYLKALKQIGSKIEPVTIKRIKAPYNSTEINSDICSATAIRELLKMDMLDFMTLKSVLPDNSFKILNHSIKNGMGPIFAKDLEQIILYKLRTISKEELKAIHDINEGFENRIKKGANIVSNYDELIDYLKTKRYTLTRIQRILIKTLIGITKKDMIMFKERFEPQYIRILGFSKKGTELLNKIKINSKLPIITNLKNYKPQNIYAEKMLYFDIISTNIYSLLFKKASLRKGGYDYTKNPYINIY